VNCVKELKSIYVKCFGLKIKTKQFAGQDNTILLRQTAKASGKGAVRLNQKSSIKNQQMYYYLVSVYLILLFIVTSLLFIPVACLLSLTYRYDRKLKALHVFSCFWGSCYTWLNPLWSVTVTGRENVDKKKAYVMVCNHQSIFDILAIYRIFLHFKWVAKASLFRIPVIGWNMKLNRYVKIERSSLGSQRKMIRECMAYLSKGSSVMIFPEGTRSRTGEMKNFKEGAFLIALQQHADIVPMALDGTYKAVSPGKIIPGSRQRFRLHILNPVPYETIRDMTAQEASKYVQDVIAAEIAHMRTCK
jgi:1-acyl-sn-glycerol-3-phosphate acyltransferase